MSVGWPGVVQILRDPPSRSLCQHLPTDMSAYGEHKEAISTDSQTPVRDVDDMGGPPWSKVSASLMWINSLCPRPALHGKAVCLSLLSFHILAVQEGKLPCAPSRTHVWSHSGSRLSVNWEINDTVATTVRGQSWSECLGQTRVSVNFGTWTKEVQWKRIVRKVLLVTSPWSCDRSKEQSSPDWAAVRCCSHCLRVGLHS